MTRKEIAKGVFYTELDGNYKKSRLSVFLAAPLKRENITDTALIPFLLERGTKSYPDVTLLKRKLNSLYGANLSTAYSCSGFSRVIEAYIEGVDGNMVEGGENLSAERAQMLAEVLFSPATENGAFCEEWVTVEREKLREVIRSIINEKRDYCLKLLLENFFEADERKLCNDGYEEDLDSITGKSLYAAYRDFIKECTIEIIYVGKPCEGAQELLCKAFSGFENVGAPKKEITAVPYGEEKRITETFAVEQDKLAMAFTCGRKLTEREMVALRVGTSILGGSATSRLFMNVREKQSLCYYASARTSFRSGGGILIDCGIDHRNTAKTKKAILNELELLCKDGPTEKELSEIKLLYANLLSSVRDTSGSLTGYCYSSLERYGRIVTPEEELAEIETLTAKEITSVLGRLHLNTSCIIEKGER